MRVRCDHHDRKSSKRDFAFVAVWELINKIPDALIYLFLDKTLVDPGLCLF